MCACGVCVCVCVSVCSVCVCVWCVCACVVCVCVCHVCVCVCVCVTFPYSVAMLCSQYETGCRPTMSGHYCEIYDHAVEIALRLILSFSPVKLNQFNVLCHFFRHKDGFSPANNLH